MVAGLLLGYAVMLSYGLPLLGLLALAVLVVARNWRPLPWAALSALAVVLTYAALGFVWWEALPALHDRYWAGVARNRPPSYWMWANLAALTLQRRADDVGRLDEPWSDGHGRSASTLPASLDGWSRPPRRWSWPPISRR